MESRAGDGCFLGDVGTCFAPQPPRTPHQGSSQDHEISSWGQSKLMVAFVLEMGITRRPKLVVRGVGVGCSDSSRARTILVNSDRRLMSVALFLVGAQCSWSPL